MRPSWVRCPRCGIRLHLGPAPDVVLHGCGRCGGIWVNVEGSWLVARALLSPRARELVEQASARGVKRKRAPRPYRERPVDEAVLRCPKCDGALSRAEVRGVTVDACAKHGTWFDAYEIEQLLGAGAEGRANVEVDPSLVVEDAAEFRDPSDRLIRALLSHEEWETS